MLVSPVTASRHSVLIVEDDADLRRLYRHALAFDGFMVREVGDGLDALRQIDANPPDLVLLDLGLPLISGITVKQEITAHAHTRHIPVLVVTGTAAPFPESDVACLLRKPVRPDELVIAVRRCLASAAGSSGA
jgi:DNA-binding response OmpR family regulator